MAQNFETRQNDVVEASNNGWPGDLLRKMYRDFKKVVKKGKESYEQGKNERNQEKQRKEQEKDQEKQRKEKERQDKKDQKRYGDTDSINGFSTWHGLDYYNEMVRNDFNDIDKLIDELHRLGNHEIKTKEVDGSYPGGEKYTDKKIYWENYELNIRDAGNSCRVESIILKDPDNPNDQVELTDPTIWDYRRAIDLIKQDCANKKQGTQDRNARAMKKAIAQNHDDYHENVEVPQADADLESALWNLA